MLLPEGEKPEVTSCSSPTPLFSVIGVSRGHCYSVAPSLVLTAALQQHTSRLHQSMQGLLFVAQHSSGRSAPGV